MIKNKIAFLFTFLMGVLTIVSAQKSGTLLEKKSIPIFENGEAQVVPGFSDEATWITHDLWVETEFDTDGDGKKDRMHVSVTRPGQTETEGLKLPIIYISSPYFAGVASNLNEIFGMYDMNWGKHPKSVYTQM